ncbi:MAG: hypothetical protein ABH886_06280 [Candidatus Desantisbacteria bacterium]
MCYALYGSFLIHLVYYSSFVSCSQQESEQTTIDNAPLSWQNATITVTITVTDPSPSSGVARTCYSVNQGTGTVGSSVVILAEGTNTLTYYSVDNAGNTEAVKTAANIVKIDKTPPVITISTPANGAIILSTHKLPLQAISQTCP